MCHFEWHSFVLKGANIKTIWLIDTNGLFHIITLRTSQKHLAGFSNVCVPSLCCAVCVPCVRRCAGLLTKEAVDDSKQATHGADDGRDDIIFPLYLQSAGIDLGHACPGGPSARPRGICHPGSMLEAQLEDVQQLAVAAAELHWVQLIRLVQLLGGDEHTDTFSLTCGVKHVEGGRRVDVEHEGFTQIFLLLALALANMLVNCMWVCGGGGKQVIEEINRW